MNFKPFCINIENMTDEQVREIFDKAVKAGAVINETVGGYNQGYAYFGVDYDNDTMFYNHVDDYHINGVFAKLITIEELDEHLGITKQSTKTPFDLRNTKIDVRKRDENGVPTNEIDVESSKAFQEACFEQGFAWGTKGQTFNHLDKPFLYAEEDYSLSQGEVCNNFLDHTPENKEITFTYERKLTWEAKEAEKKKETITLPNGDVYDAEELQKALSNIKKLN